MHIKEITSQDTYAVRHPVLRAGKPIEACYFDGDDLATTKHFGIFEEDTLLGVVSIFKNNHANFEDTPSYQIRGMAVLENYQKQGLGHLLIEQCENYVLGQESNLIWFNARKNAVGFYEKSGYKIIGDAFEIKSVGTHFVMYKNLRN